MSAVKELHTGGGENRFRFQSFKMRIDRLKISALHRTRPSSEVPTPPHDTFFREALVDWTELNTTLAYKEVQKKVWDWSYSLPLLVEYAGDVVNAVLEGVEREDPLSLEPLLDLLVKLARDLRSEFYPHAPRILPVLVRLLRHNDVKIIEWALNTISFLFKFLSPLLVPELPLVYGYIAPALGKDAMFDKKPHVRRFVAEAFAFLMHKARGDVLRQTIKVVLNDLVESASASAKCGKVYEDGIAHLWFESVKQVDSRLHSRAETVFREIVAETIAACTPQLSQFADGATTATPSTALDVLYGAVLLITHHVDPDYIEPIWKVIMESAASEDQIIRTAGLKMMLHCISVDKASRIKDFRALHKSLFAVLAHSMANPASTLPQVVQAALEAFAMALQYSPLEDVIGLGKITLDAICAHSDSHLLDTLCSLMASIQWKHFTRILLPLLIKSVPRHWSGNEPRYIVLLADLQAKGLLATKTVALTRPGINGRIHFPACASKGEASISADLVKLVHGVAGTADDLNLITCAVSLLRVIAVDNLSALAALRQRFSLLAPIILSANHFNLHLASLVIQAAVDIALSLKTPSNTDFVAIGELISKSDVLNVLIRSPITVSSVLSFYKVWTNGITADVQPIALASLSEPSSIVRQSALEFLLLQSESSPSDTAFLQSALTMETTPSTLESYRSRLVICRQLCMRAFTLSELQVEILIRLTLAMFTEKLSILWPEILPMLEKIAASHPKLVWSVISVELTDKLASLDMRLERSDDRPSGQPLSSKNSDADLALLWRSFTRTTRFLADFQKAWSKTCAADSAPYLVEIATAITTDDSHTPVDAAGYITWLLKALKTCHSVARSHSGDLFGLFRSIFAKNNNAEISANSHRDVLCAFVDVFAAVGNMSKKLIDHKVLWSYCLQLIANSDPRVQRSALECVFSWKKPALRPYETYLRDLMDESKLRDILLTLRPSGHEAIVDERHRAELFEIMVPLLYGRMTCRQIKSTAKHSLESRRTGILVWLACLEQDEIRGFIRLMLRPFHPIIGAEAACLVPVVNAVEAVAPKRILGFLNALGDVVKQLSIRAEAFYEELFPILVWVLRDVQATLSSAMNLDSPPAHGSGALKEIRQQAMKRVSEIFQTSEKFDFTPYMPIMFDTFFADRFRLFSSEGAHGPSALLTLFVSWVNQPKFHRLLVWPGCQPYVQVVRVLAAEHVVDSVATAVLDVLTLSLDFADQASSIGQFFRESIIEPNAGVLVNGLESIIKTKAANVKMTALSIRTLARIMNFVKEHHVSLRIINLLLPILKKGSRAAPESTKSQILEIFAHFMRQSGMSPDVDPHFRRYFGTVAALFGTLQGRRCRATLVNLIESFSIRDPSLLCIVPVLGKLNAYSTRRMDEPDYDARLEALAEINDSLHSRLTPDQWLPILHNCFYLAQDTEELAMRSNATYTIARFLDCCAAERNDGLLNLLQHVVYPGIKATVRFPSDSVKMEAMTMLTTATRVLPDHPLFSGLRVLQDTDEEANILANIYHIQFHRRLRALRRLADACKAKTIHGAVILDFFIPILEAFALSNVDHNLSTEAINCLSAAASVLSWSAYYSLVLRYFRMLKLKPENEKLFIRMLVGILESFHFSDVSFVESEEDETMEEPSEELEEATVEELSPNMSKMELAITRKIIPELRRLLTKGSGEEEKVLRIPVALAIAKLLLAMPEKTLRVHLQGLLMTVCQALRSRSLDVRSSTRETLVKIAQLLGPKYIFDFVRELKSALSKGYQLHVLGYTLNVLLKNMTLVVGDVSAALPLVLGISINDIFGSVGDEKDNSEITGKVMEARSKKSYDTLELLARFCQKDQFEKLLAPLMDIIGKSLSEKITRKVGECLQRLSQGLLENPDVGPHEITRICTTNIKQMVIKVAPSAPLDEEEVAAIPTYAVEIGRKTQKHVDGTSSNAYMLPIFGLELLSASLRQKKFDVESKADCDSLDSLVDCVGDSLYSKHDQVVVLALKCMSTLCLLPLGHLKNGLAAVVVRVFQILKSNGDSGSEIVQQCFRLLTVVVRHCKHIDLDQVQLAYLLDRLRPDLMDSDRQAAIFGLVRAILSRRFVVAEIYDILGEVGEIMITSQAGHVRSLCRQVYLQFLLDYPQGKGRMQKQMTFLLKNLGFVHESGRESVMELLHQVILKFGDEALEPFMDLTFVTLIMSMVNDESQRCREMSTRLIRSLFERMNDAHIDTSMLLIMQWFASDKLNLNRAACQTVGVLYNSAEPRLHAHVPRLLERLSESLQRSLSLLSDAESSGRESSEIEWSLGYYALVALSKIAAQYPGQLIGNQSAIDHIQRHLLHPHQWIRIQSANIFGHVFNQIDPQTMSTSDGSGGPVFTVADIDALAKAMVTQLYTENLGQEFATQIVKNIFFLGRCLIHASSAEQGSNDDGESSDSDGSDIVVAPSKTGIDLMFSRLSRMANREGFTGEKLIMRPHIYRWFAAMVNYMPVDRLVPVLYEIALPVYRTINVPNGKDEVYDELKVLSTELLEMVQAKVGMTTYFDVYNRIRNEFSENRLGRKQRIAEQAVANPEAFAKRKLAKSAKKQRDRKRKTESQASNKERLTTIKRRKGIIEDNM